MTYVPSSAGLDGLTDGRPEIWATPVTPAANSPAVVTIAAVADASVRIQRVLYSYSDIPTGGRITIAIGGTTVLDLDTADSGPAALPIEKPIRAGVNEAVVITLAAGGSGIVGKLNVQYA